MNGILNVFKPEGITSNGAINIVKRVSGEKKVGHTGTLDPLAQGVLPLFLGKFTKLVPYFNADIKRYHVVARLGASSTTLDREGDIEPAPMPENISADLLSETVDSFLGKSMQVPPMYSAVKIKGKKLYEYARKGVAVERKPRSIEILELAVDQINLPDFAFSVTCSKGTYVRTLADDIGRKLGTRAYLLALTRVSVGRFFHRENAVKLEQIKKMDKSDLQKAFIDPEYILLNWHNVLVDSKILQEHISQGRAFSVPSDAIRFSSLGKQFSNAFARSQEGVLMATGTLEFSQDSKCRFVPEKVFI